MANISHQIDTKDGARGGSFYVCRWGYLCEVRMCKGPDEKWRSNQTFLDLHG